MLSDTYIAENVTKLLPIDSSMYEDQLDILIGGAVNRLKNEGVDNIYTEDTNEAKDYIVCLSYQVAMDLDLDIDLERMKKQYISRVVTLRESIV